MGRLRLGVVCDLAEENWPSMDLVAYQLLERLNGDFAGEIEAVALRPVMHRRFTRLPGLAAHGRADILDRLANRYFDYPRWLRRNRSGLDVFHVVDHSYAQLVMQLPGERTVVTCHDLDAFRCVLRSDLEPRSRAFRALVRAGIRGLQRAARIACVSAATRDELEQSGLVDPARLRLVPHGVDERFSPAPDPDADARARELLGSAADAIHVLHVGSVIPRKRIDVLLQAFAIISRREPRVRLVRTGGVFTPEQRRLAAELGVDERVLVLPFVDTRLLAAIYRRAAVCLLTSDREGFGLPVLEALACGTPIIASDLRPLRETGGDAVTYCPPGDAEAFARAAISVIEGGSASAEDHRARVSRSVAHARQFTWHAHAAAMVRVYRELV